MNFDLLTHKKIAIIGGTGTLGKSILKQLIALNMPSEVLIVSRDEVKQLEMIDEFERSPITINYLLGDVRDPKRMVEVLSNIDIVIHAAALKHVVMAENNPEECYKTNVEGTKNVISACKVNKVSQALLISSDKAESPFGVYGRSKFEAEQLFLSENASSTFFKVVRFGNIIGSRGSVIEKFKKQKAKGTLKVCHPDATRFFISQGKAAEFVLETLADTSYGKISFPKMRSFRILDLAKSICPNCKIEFIGLRPGDKLHEELGGICSNDAVESECSEFI